MKKILHLGIDAILESGCALLTPARNSRQNPLLWVSRALTHQWSPWIALAGIDTPLAHPCADHITCDLAAVGCLVAAHFLRHDRNFRLHEYTGRRALPSRGSEPADCAAGTWGELEGLVWETYCVDSVVEGCWSVKLNESHVVIMSLCVIFRVNVESLDCEILFGSLRFV